MILLSHLRTKQLPQTLQVPPPFPLPRSEAAREVDCVELAFPHLPFTSQPGFCHHEKRAHQEGLSSLHVLDLLGSFSTATLPQYQPIFCFLVTSRSWFSPVSLASPLHVCRFISGLDIHLHAWYHHVNFPKTNPRLVLLKLEWVHELPGGHGKSSFWFRRVLSGLERLHFQNTPEWCWRSADYTLRSKVLNIPLWAAVVLSSTLVTT